MNRSISLAAIIIGAAILVNGYLERLARTPQAIQGSEKQLPEVREKSIAVLPFQDLSSPDQNADFAGSIQQEITNRLTKVHDLKVISQSDVMGYRAAATRNLREIGKHVGAANLLEGRVQRTDDRVRVSVQLIDAKMIDIFGPRITTGRLQTYSLWRARVQRRLQVSLEPGSLRLRRPPSRKIVVTHEA